MAKESIPYVMKQNYISVVIPTPTGGTRSFALDGSHPTFARMKTALRKRQWKKIPTLVSIAEAVEKGSNGNIRVSPKGVTYKGRIVHSSLTKRIVGMVKEGKPVKHMLKFMDNLYKNPSEDSIRELFDWMENCKLPITDDGCFVAYKWVKDGYKDSHTGRIDNSVGQVVKMERKQVDTNRRNECSYGLHFCSRTYLPNMGSGGHVMKVKINPKDVVAIPQDHSSSKGRCCQYEVLGEVKPSDKKVLDITDIAEFQTSVVPVGRDRKALLKQILTNKSIQRNIKSKKVKKATILKMTFGRLQALALKLLENK